MAASTGPILAVGAITMANQTIFNGKPPDIRVAIGTGIAAAVFALGERVAPDAIPLLAWVALATVVLARVDPSIPSPAESALNWWEGKKR